MNADIIYFLYLLIFSLFLVIREHKNKRVNKVKEKTVTLQNTTKQNVTKCDIFSHRANSSDVHQLKYV